MNNTNIEGDTKGKMHNNNFVEKKRISQKMRLLQTVSKNVNIWLKLVRLFKGPQNVLTAPHALLAFKRFCFIKVV